MPKQESSKVCGRCRYFVQRWWGGRPETNMISDYGLCEGFRGVDLMKKGRKYVGFVHRKCECQLPNVGKQADWKPIVRVPASYKKSVPYSMHPHAKNENFRSNQYQRDWLMEQERG